MKQYVTWKLVPVEWGMKHPITHDWDKEYTNNRVDFFETPYSFSDGRNLAIITYDENTITQEELDSYKLIEPLFELTIISESDINTLFLNEYEWLVSVTDFVFLDNRPRD